MTNLNTAANAAPSVLVARYAPTTGVALYQADVGTTAEFASVLISNTDTVPRTVTVTVVRSGDSVGSVPPILAAVSVVAKDVIDLGQMFLGDGDFIWVEAVTASTIGVVITGIEFDNATGSVLSGIQDDAVGTLGRTASSGSVTSLCHIGAANNRRLYGMLMVTHHSAAVGYASYDTLNVGLGGGLFMTRKVSKDFTQSSNINGSIHIFEYTAPTSSSNQTLTANVADSGLVVDLTLFSFSLSGVASSTVTATTGPTSAAAMSLPLTSAVGHRALVAACFQDAPMDFACTEAVGRVRSFGGSTAIAAAVPHWMIVADALGAATNTFTASNSLFHAGVALDLVPA